MLAHTLGNPFNLQAVTAFCREHGLWLVEDNCDALGSVVLPDSVVSVWYSAFSNCDALTDVVLSRGMTSINDNVFAYCTSLVNVSIPDTVKSIDQYSSSVMYLSNSI